MRGCRQRSQLVHYNRTGWDGDTNFNKQGPATAESTDWLGCSTKVNQFGMQHFIWVYFSCDFVKLGGVFCLGHDEHETLKHTRINIYLPYSWNSIHSIKQCPTNSMQRDADISMQKHRRRAVIKSAKQLTSIISVKSVQRTMNGPNPVQSWIRV